MRYEIGLFVGTSVRVSSCSWFVGAHPAIYLSHDTLEAERGPSMLGFNLYFFKLAQFVSSLLRQPVQSLLSLYFLYLYTLLCQTVTSLISPPRSHQSNIETHTAALNAGVFSFNLTPRFAFFLFDFWKHTRMQNEAVHWILLNVEPNLEGSTAPPPGVSWGSLLDFVNLQLGDFTCIWSFFAFSG